MDTREIFISVALNVSQFQAVEANPSKLLEYLDESMMDKIQAFVFDSLQNKDGSPEMSELELSAFKHEPETNSGSFRLRFILDRRFCCSDMNSCSADYIDFKYQYQDQQINAVGSYFDWSLSN